MNIVCLDLEGVLVPEIWIAFAEASGIPELKLTTRDEPDYDKLMKYRLDILKKNGIGINEIKKTIDTFSPTPSVSLSERQGIPRRSPRGSSYPSRRDQVPPSSSSRGQAVS